MTRSASVSHLSSEFNEFLFAQIGEDTSGMRLSVLSALARLNLDPWQEAAELARLPKGTATQRLSTLIATLPNRPSSHLDLGTTAARLISFLPRHPRSEVQLRGTGVPTNSRAVLFMIIVMVFMLAVEWIVANGRLRAQADTALAPISSMDSPEPSLPNFSR
jgi:hypothetical protein